MTKTDYEAHIRKAQEEYRRKSTLIMETLKKYIHPSCKLSHPTHDEPGLLSVVLQTIARFHGNILTIHQSIPINGIATLTLSVDILPGEGDAEAMVETIEQNEGIHYLKILGRE